jgi:putative dehydrogenase
VAVVVTTIGFVGLGAMGLPMARNLVAGGFTVRGFDMRRTAVDALVQAGGMRVHSAVEAARHADVLLLMVVNAGQAEHVLFADGALESLSPDGIVILMATCPPGAVEALATRVLATGRRFIDSPVSGGVVGAVGGTLSIIAAAQINTFNAAKPVFDRLGDKVFYIGERPGQAAMVKAVNQLLCGVHIAVAAEALSLAARVGVDLNVILTILGASSAASWMLKDRGPRMLRADPEVTSAVDIFVKDLGIVLEAGRETKAALPFAALAHQLFLATSGRGDGVADDSQVIRSYFALNGRPISE